MEIQTSTRSSAIKWLKGKRDFNEGIELLRQSGFKPAVVKKLAKVGREGPCATERLLFLIRELISIFSTPQPQVETVPDTDAELHVFEGQEAPADNDEKESVAILAVAERIESGKEQKPDNITSIIREYATQYKKRDKAFREMQSMDEDNNINTMLKRKELSDIIDQCTTLMENLYPFYDDYLKKGVVPDNEAMKSLETTVPSTSGGSPELTPEEETAVDEELKALTVEELKYRKTRTKTKIARARNMINFQQETKAKEPNPLPEGPLKAKYEKKIEILSAYLEKIDYELVARM